MRTNIAEMVTKMNNYDHLIECKICGKPFTRDNLIFTHDCHGIPFRLVCYDCYDHIMETKGYDGEYYTELDENIWDY